MSAFCPKCGAAAVDQWGTGQSVTTGSFEYDLATSVMRWCNLETMFACEAWIDDTGVLHRGRNGRCQIRERDQQIDTLTAKRDAAIAERDRMQRKLAIACEEGKKLAQENDRVVSAAQANHDLHKFTAGKWEADYDRQEARIKELEKENDRLRAENEALEGTLGIRDATIVGMGQECNQLRVARDRLLEHIGELTGKLDGLRLRDESLSRVMSEIQRHQPAGSPPLGDELCLVFWVLKSYRDELDRLRAVVERLPHTANGVPAYYGMQLWRFDGIAIRGPEQAYEVYLDGCNVGNPGLIVYRPFTQLYSSRETAEAAKGGG